MQAKIRPTVSVALALCNGSAFLREQLESLIRQDEPPDEIVVFDDASDDDSLTIVREISLACPIRFTIKPREARVGYEKNFLEAAAACTSELIAFCDQDDVWSPEKLRLIRSEFEQLDVMMVYHNARVVSRTLADLGALYHQPTHDFKWAAMTRNPWDYPLGFTQVFRRELLLFNHFHHLSRGILGPSCMGHDYWIGFLASSLGAVSFLSADLVQYRQHGRNVFGRAKSDQSKLARVLEDFRRLRSPQFSRLIQLTNLYAEIMSEAKDVGGLSAVSYGGAREAATLYKELSSLYIERCQIYQNSSVIRRAIGYLNLVFQGRYSRPRPWSFGYRSAIRDLMVGVIFGPLSMAIGNKLSWADGGLRSSGAPDTHHQR